MALSKFKLPPRRVPECPYERIEDQEECCEPLLLMQIEVAVDVEFSVYRLNRMKKLLKGEVYDEPVDEKMLKVPKFVKQVYGKYPTRAVQMKVKAWVKDRRFPMIIEMLKNEKELIESWLETLKNPSIHKIKMDEMLESVSKLATETEEHLSELLAELSKKSVEPCGKHRQ